MSGEMLVKAPKSEAGRRTIAIPPNVVPALKIHLEKFVSSGPDSPVIVGEKGGPLLPQVLAKSWSKACKKVGLTDLRFHDLQTLRTHLVGCCGCHRRRTHEPRGPCVSRRSPAVPTRDRGP